MPYQHYDCAREDGSIKNSHDSPSLQLNPQKRAFGLFPRLVMWPRYVSKIKLPEAFNSSIALTQKVDAYKITNSTIQI